MKNKIYTKVNKDMNDNQILPDIIIIYKIKYITPSTERLDSRLDHKV